MHNAPRLQGYHELEEAIALDPEKVTPLVHHVDLNGPCAIQPSTRRVPGQWPHGVSCWCDVCMALTSASLPACQFCPS